MDRQTDIPIHGSRVALLRGRKGLPAEGRKEGRKGKKEKKKIREKKIFSTFFISLVSFERNRAAGFEAMLHIEIRKNCAKIL